MKVMHLISGGDTGGAKTHVITLLKELKNQVDIMLVCLMEGEFSRDAKKAGIPVTVVEQKQRYDLTVVKKLKQLYEQGDYDLLHCHGARANFIAVFLRIWAKIPVVTTVHSDYRLDFDDSLYRKWIYTNINSVALRMLPYYIAVTDNFKQLLMKRNFNPERIYITYNGIQIDEQLPTVENPSVFLKKHQIDNFEDHLYIGIVARLHPVKGIEIFLQAAKQIIQEYPKVRFLLAGGGECMEEYKAWVQKNNLTSSIFFLGHITDIESFYHTIDINVLTSYSESFPYALLEAAQQKKATVSSAVGGIPEMIEDHRSGYLFPPGDVEALVSYLKELIESPDKRKALGEQFYERVKEKFSATQMAASHVEIYKQIKERSLK